MPFFVAIGFDKAPHAMTQRDSLRVEHRGYVLGNAAPIRLAGAMVDEARNQCGSLYVFEAESAHAVRLWFAAEPFFQAGVYETLAVREIEAGVLWTLPATTASAPP